MSGNFKVHVPNQNVIFCENFPENDPHSTTLHVQKSVVSATHISVLGLSFLEGMLQKVGAKYVKNTKFRRKFCAF